jgi:hypothetical protein
MMSYTERWYPTGNCSSRGGSKITQVTFHTTQGAIDGDDLAGWIQNPASQVSYHGAVDNKQPGLVFRYVDSEDKAWAQAAGNPFALSICFCTFAENSRDEWLSMGWMLDSGAALARTFCDWYGIPIKELNNSESQNGLPGINQHSNGGASWSGHYDCGSNFPMDVMLDKIRGQGGSTAPTPETGGDMAVGVATDPDGNKHYACIGASNGALYYLPPGWDNWGRIDAGQSGAKSGAGITISNDWWVTLTYTNTDSKPCQYRKKFREGSWVWSGIGDILAR